MNTDPKAYISKLSSSTERRLQCPLSGVREHLENVLRDAGGATVSDDQNDQSAGDYYISAQRRRVGFKRRLTRDNGAALMEEVGALRLPEQYNIIRLYFRPIIHTYAHNILILRIYELRDARTHYNSIL